jgi:hypothetical protein
VIRSSYVVLATLSLGVGVSAQSPAPRKLGAPTASLDQEFTTIDGVRELKDGRLILLDARDFAIHVVDLKAKSTRKIGRRGDGPGEFQLPRSVLPSRGDTTLLLDMARFNKVAVITPAGEIGGFISTVDSAVSLRGFIVGASDLAGRLYENSYGGDSNSIVRWDRGSGRRDTLGHLSMKVVSPLVEPAQARTGGAPGSAAGGGRSAGGGERAGARAGSPPPFFSVTEWAVSPDGRVAIVTPQPYRVTLVNSSGTRVQGAPIPVAVISVGDAEKEQFHKDRQKPVAQIAFANGVQTTSYVKPRYTPPDEWPTVMPAFVKENGVNAATFASDGMLWVKRATKAGAPPLFDVFDPSAKLSYQLELPAGRKLIGFGNGVVYLARVDDDDLHYLERYALPATRPVRP